MKNTARIRQNGARKRTASQVQTPAACLPEPGIDHGIYGGKTAICMIIFDGYNETTIAGCDLSRKALKSLKATASAAGVPLGTFLKRFVSASVLQTKGVSS